MKFDKIALYARKIKTLHGKQRIAYLLQQAISLRAVYKNIKLFEDMAEAYEYAAKQYAIYITKNEKLADEIMQKSMKYVMKLNSYARKIFTEEADIRESEIDKILYPIQSYKHFYRIQGTYWETMKRMQDKVSYNLTKQQYDYINEQIEAIMSTHLFRSSMGLTNFKANEKQQ
jgi:hypothetical protein